MEERVPQANRPGDAIVQDTVVIVDHATGAEKILGLGRNSKTIEGWPLVGVLFR